jgi:hypothetical protein
MPQHWKSIFDELIALPDVRKLRTLQEAIAFLSKEIPRSEHTLPKVQAAARMVSEAAENNGPMIFAEAEDCRGGHYKGHPLRAIQIGRRGLLDRHNVGQGGGDPNTQAIAMSGGGRSTIPKTVSEQKAMRLAKLGTAITVQEVLADRRASESYCMEYAACASKPEKLGESLLNCLDEEAADHVREMDELNTPDPWD